MIVNVNLGTQRKGACAGEAFRAHPFQWEGIVNFCLLFTTPIKPDQAHKSRSSAALLSACACLGCRPGFPLKTNGTMQIMQPPIMCKCLPSQFLFDKYALLHAPTAAQVVSRMESADHWITYCEVTDGAVLAPQARTAVHTRKGQEVLKVVCPCSAYSYKGYRV
eukprot:1158306-Pelagomonas_calceolata.AAC.17